MTAEIQILDGILSAVAKYGEYSIDSTIIINGLFHRSATIKSIEALQKWAKDNDLKLGSAFVGHGTSKRLHYIFRK